MKRTALLVLAVLVVLTGCIEKNSSTINNNYFYDSNSTILAEDSNQYGDISFQIIFVDPTEGKLIVTRNPTPDFTVVANQKDVVLSSWSFDASHSNEDIKVPAITWIGEGKAASNTTSLATFIDVNKNGEWDEDIDKLLYPIIDYPSSPEEAIFNFTEPITIPKETSIHIALKGDKDPTETTEPDNTESWGLNDTSVFAYEALTKNTIVEQLTADKGPTLTSINQGTLVVDTVNNPASGIIVANSSDIAANFYLASKYEDADLEEFTINVVNDDKFCSEIGDYRDVHTITLYENKNSIYQFSIPSTGYYTVIFPPNSFIISKGSTGKKLTAGVTMSGIDPEANNAPGTANAGLRISISDVKATGMISNRELTVTAENTFGRTIVLRNSTVHISCSGSYNTFGAAIALSNGDICIYGIQIYASGKDVLTYKLTFKAVTKAELLNPRLDDQYGNVIAEGEWIYSDGQYTVSFYLDNPDFDSGLEKEAIKIPGDQSRTFNLYTTVNGASTGDYIVTQLILDKECASMNTAEEIAAESNFVWSDNHQELSISNGDAVSARQWYNGNLLHQPSLYIISY